MIADAFLVAQKVRDRAGVFAARLTKPFGLFARKFSKYFS